MVTGVVLAGGRSRRFGERDKALATVESGPMIERVAERVGGVADRVVISCRADQRPAFEDALARLDVPVEYSVDRVPDEGPLAGLRQALELADDAVAVVVACDMPGVDPGFLSYLLARLDGHDAVVPALRDGTLQPAQAVYRVPATIDAAETELADGKGSLRGALASIDVHVVQPDEVATRTSWRSLRDVNTTDELASFLDEGE